jgi:hypothetical protein
MRENPFEKKESLTNEKTFGKAFQMHMERHAKIENKTWKETEGIINKFLQHWFQRKLSSIIKYEVQELHVRVGQENGKSRANKILAWVSAIYNKMIRCGWEGTNPAIGIAKFKEQKRDRFILHDELPKFTETLNSEPNRDMRDFFLMCLYTGPAVVIYSK